MKRIVNKIAVTLVMLSAFLILPSQASEAPFESVTYTWKQGAFSGGKYKLTLLDGKVQWHGLQGPEKGMSAIENKTAFIKLTPDQYLITWLEKVGYTVTVIINTGSNKVTGIVSNAKEHYVLAGQIDTIQL